MPKLDADLYMIVDLPLDKKTLENQAWVSGPPGHCRPQAAGLSRAVGRWAFGLPGRWAMAGRGPLGRRPAFSKTREKYWERARVYTRAKTSEDFGLRWESSEMIMSSSKFPALPR